MPEFKLDLLTVRTPCARCSRVIPAGTLAAVDDCYAQTEDGPEACAINCLLCAGQVLSDAAEARPILVAVAPVLALVPELGSERATLAGGAS